MARKKTAPKLSNRQIAHELKKIEDKSGGLNPKSVVEAARMKDHPLHSKFTWDDSEAAEKWRLEEARALIASVKVEVEVEERRVVVPGYHRDPHASPAETAYRSREAIQQDPDDARTVVITEFVAAAAHLKRARNVAKAFGQSERIDELISDLDRLRVEIVNQVGSA
jgi:hypothetical protein